MGSNGHFSCMKGDPAFARERGAGRGKTAGPDRSREAKGETKNEGSLEVEEGGAVGCGKPRVNTPAAEIRAETLTIP